MIKPIKCILVLLLILVLSCSSKKVDSFSIHFITKDHEDIEKVEYEEAPILDGSNVVRYDWSKHDIELTEKGMTIFPKIGETGLRLCVVIVNDKKIYKCMLWSYVISRSYGNTIILRSMDKQNTIEIRKAYHEDVTTDSRNNNDIYKTLKAMGKIK